MVYSQIMVLQVTHTGITKDSFKMLLQMLTISRQFVLKKRSVKFEYCILVLNCEASSKNKRALVNNQ